MTAYRDKWLVYGDGGALLFETFDFADVERAEREREFLSWAHVTAEDQRREAEREQHDRERREQLQHEAEQRAYERTPEGKHEAALRTAANNPGGIVTVVGTSEAFEELEGAWGRERDPLVGEW